MKISPYFLLAFLLSNTTPSNGHQLLRGDLPIPDQETNFVADKDGALDTTTISLSDGSEQGHCGCSECTSTIWNSNACRDDLGGCYTCGSRIDYLKSQGKSEEDACTAVSNQFSNGPCGPVCNPSVCIKIKNDCEQVLVVVRHGQDKGQRNFPKDTPNYIQGKDERVYAKNYALNDVGHATAMFLRDHLDSFLESNNYCAVTKAEVVRPGTSNPLTTLSPWAAQQKHSPEHVKYKFVASEDQDDDGAHSNEVGSSTAGSRLIVSTGKALWATKKDNCSAPRDCYPRINDGRVLAKMLNGSPDDFCLPRHGENFIYIYRGMQGNGKWSTVEQRRYHPDTGKISPEHYVCKGADNKDGRTPV